MAEGVKDGSARLWSLDALRGFDMLMITGLSGVLINFLAMLGVDRDSAFILQFSHVEWNGLRFQDTIFPLFLFLAGVSWPFSYASQRNRGISTRQSVLKCIKRAAVLFLLGLIYAGLLSCKLRMGTVLGRIGIAWMAGALLYMFCRRRTLFALAFAIPIAYWMLLYFVPAPDASTVAIPEKLAHIKEFGTGPFSIVGNLSGWIDRTFMPGMLFPYTGIADNQSALGFIPAIGTALLGILAGDFVHRTRETMAGGIRVMWMLAAAAALAVIGLVIANCFGEMSMPVNKKLWSASFVFVVGGYSLAMFALFHWIIDVLGFVRWTFFFRVVGMNSITIYLAYKFIPFAVIAERIFGGLALRLPAAAGEFALSLASLAVSWSFLLFLYRHKVFLKV